MPHTAGSHPPRPATPPAWSGSSVLGLSFGTALIVLSMAGSTAPSPFYPIWQQELGLDTAFLTIIFALYPISLLLTLFIAGSLSDHLGRRIVISLAFVLLAIAFMLFTYPATLTTLLTARSLQGIAVGLAMSTLGAYTTELQPPHLAGSAALLNAVGPTLGLGLGALISGVLLDVIDSPGNLVFGAFAGVSIVAALCVWLFPETAPRTPGVWRSLIPRVRVGIEVKSAFLRCLPVLIATWATGGLFISLGPSIFGQIFQQHGHIVQSLSIVLLAGAGTLAVLLLHRRPTRLMYIGGLIALVVGTLGGVAAVLADAFLPYLIAIAVTGCGWGTAYAGALRILVPRAPDNERAALFSAIYLVTYLGFGLPAFFAGIGTVWVGLLPTVVVYGIVVTSLTLFAIAYRPESAPSASAR